jgi:hypothetical protein
MANQTCMQRIETDLIPIIRKYSTGSISDCIRAMEQRIQVSTPAKNSLTDADKKWIKATIEEQIETLRRG